MSSRFVHRLLQIRRALPPIRRSYSPAKIPPETSMVSTAFSNAFSSSSGDPNTFTSSSHAKPPPSASTAPTIFRKELSSSTTSKAKDAARRSRDEDVQSLDEICCELEEKIRLELAPNPQKGVEEEVVARKLAKKTLKYVRSMRQFRHLIDELNAITRHRDDEWYTDQMTRMNAMIDEHWKLLEAFDDGLDGYEDCETEEDLEKFGYECLEKLREMNESISEINVFAKIMASLLQREEKEKWWTSPVMLFLLLVILFP